MAVIHLGCHNRFVLDLVKPLRCYSSAICLYAIRVVWLIYLSFISKYNIWGKKLVFYVIIFVCVSASDSFMLQFTYFCVYAWCNAEHKSKILHSTWWCMLLIFYLCPFSINVCHKAFASQLLFSVSFASLSAAGTESDEYGKKWGKIMLDICICPSKCPVWVSMTFFFDHLVYFSHINYYNYLKLFWILHCGLIQGFVFRNVFVCLFTVLQKLHDCQRCIQSNKPSAENFLTSNVDFMNPLVYLLTEQP